MAAAAAPRDGASSINVTVRVRPFTIQEAAQLSRNEDNPLFLGDGSLAAAPTPKLAQKGIRSVIKVVDDKCLIFDPPQDSPVQRYGSTIVGKKVKDTTFAFDRVFDENATQVDVYEASTKSLLDSVLDGFNATVFAYGATGCGKTHTITGTSNQPGIIFMTMQELFERIEELKETKETEVTLSYLEIYNETIRDLLNPSSASKGGLMLREDSNQAVSVAGLSSHRPQSVDDVMDIVIRGNTARTQSPTEANATSSRSHAVLQVNISLKDRNAGVHEPVTFATLSIIDLAGSERASATKNRGARLQEGANINKSLLALGSCINALCENRKSVHVPYRNSKLTRLLKFSLGGNCRTVMIVCVSPSSQHYDETQNTLRYANRAKNIQTKSVRNLYNVDRHVKDYVKKIADQVSRIQELEKQLEDGSAGAMKKLRKAQSKLDGALREAIVRVRTAYDHSAPDRKDRLTLACRDRLASKRIASITGWVGAFDGACDAREDEEPAPALAAMRQAAVAILNELDVSRSHYRMKQAGINWMRAIDTAFQDCLRQFQENSAFEEGCAAEVSLRKEVEILKMRADLEISTALLEQDKASEGAVQQVVLQAQFEAISIMNQLAQMSDDELATATREIITQLLQSCTDAVGQVIKPDGSLQIMHPVPPTKAGTPRKQKALLPPSPTKTKVRNSISTQPRLSGLPAHLLPEMQPPSPRVGSSPVRGAYSSPKRRVKLGGSARKGVQFSSAGTPKKRSNQKKLRYVRWKDESAEDGGEPGSLVEFQPTPKMLKDSPLVAGDDDSTPIEPPKLSSGLAMDNNLDSSPLPIAPSSSGEPRRPGSGRFASGFLSKSKTENSASPLMPPPSLSFDSFSSEDESSPLREIGANRAPQPSLKTITNQSIAIDGSDASDRENIPESSGSTTSSDVEGPGLDKQSIDVIRHSMVRKKRSSSMGSNTASRLKERAERRRSPTASSFTGSSPSSDSTFSASHARRMVGSARDDSTRASLLSPRVNQIDKAHLDRSHLRHVRRSASDVLDTSNETPTGARPRQHIRASSVVPGSANAIRSNKDPWR